MRYLRHLRLSFTRMASEDIIKHIIRDIVQRSTIILKADATEKAPSVIEGSILSTASSEIFVGGIPSCVQQATVSDTLTAFMIRSAVLDPGNSFGMERELSADQVEKLIQVGS